MMSHIKRMFILLPLIGLVAFLINTTALTAVQEIPPTVVYPTLADLGVQVEDISSPQWPIADSKMAMIQAQEPPVTAMDSDPFPLEPFAPTGHFELRLFGDSQKVAVGPEDMVIGYKLKGIFSDNQGISWRLIHPDMRFESTSHINMPPTVNEPIFVITGGSLYRSSDRGQSWEHLKSFFDFRQSIYSPTYERDNLLFGLLRGDFSTLARSVDDGDSWVTNPVPLINSMAIAPDFADRPLMLSENSNVVYYSPDGGYNWQLATHGLDIEFNNSINQVFFAPNHATDNMAFALTKYGLYRSVTNGREWSRFLPYTIKKFVLHPQYPAVPTFFMIATIKINEQLVDALFRSDDNGATYQALVIGIGVYDFSLSPDYGVDNYNLYAMVSEGLIHSYDNGTTWYIMSQSTRGAASLQLVTSPTITADKTIYVFMGNRLLKTANLGFTWQDLPLPSLEAGFKYLAISPSFAVDNTLLLLSFSTGGLQKLFRSTDRGQSWTLINDQLPFGDATSVKFSPDYDQDKTIFVSSYFQFAPHANGLFRSQNGGVTWQNLYPNQYLQDFAISPQYPLDLRMFVAVLNEGIARSIDGGATWTPLDTPYRNVNLYLSPNFQQDNTLFIGSWRSNDAGDSWEELSNDEIAYYNSTLLALSSQFGQDQTTLTNVSNRGVFMSETAGDKWFPLEGISRVEGIGRELAAIPYVQGRPTPMLMDGFGFYVYVWPTLTGASFGCQSLTLENDQPQTAQIAVSANTTQPFGWQIHEQSAPWLTVPITTSMVPVYPQVEINTAELTTPTTAPLTVDVFLSYRQKQTHTVSAFAPCFGQNLPIVRRN